MLLKTHYYFSLFSRFDLSLFEKILQHSNSFFLIRICSLSCVSKKKECSTIYPFFHLKSNFLVFHHFLGFLDRNLRQISLTFFHFFFFVSLKILGKKTSNSEKISLKYFERKNVIFHFSDHKTKN